MAMKNCGSGLPDNIDPTETPFVSGIQRVKTAAVLHE